METLKAASAGEIERLKKLLQARPSDEQLSDMKSSIAMLTGQNERLKVDSSTRISNLLSEIEKLEASKAKLEADLNAAGQHEQALRDQLTKFRQAEAASQLQIQDLTSRLAIAEKALGECQGKRDAENEHCVASLSGLKTQLATIRGKVADNDKDGIINISDKCPDTPRQEPVNAHGCPPDSDRDGVTDRVDLCPTTPAGNRVDETGCEPNQAIRLEGVNFVTNSDVLLPASTTILDRVASTLSTHRQLRVEIAGHTDSIGDAAYNNELSRRRAESVRNYLVNRGISANRMMARGYGESRPIADNRSVRGRAQNRRVELLRLK